MDILLIIILSVKLHTLCKRYDISASRWILRFVLFSIFGELVLIQIFFIFIGQDFFNQLQWVALLGFLSCSLIVLWYWFIRGILKRHIDQQQQDEEPLPEKDLSHFR